MARPNIKNERVIYNGVLCEKIYTPDGCIKYKRVGKGKDIPRRKLIGTGKTIWQIYEEEKAKKKGEIVNG